MHLDDIKAAVKSIPLDALRMENDNFIEVVVLKKDIGSLKARMDELFGQPLWPSDNKLSTAVHEVIKNFGGIMVGQTLYYSKQQDCALFAMFWPWSDGEHTTVKAGKK